MSVMTCETCDRYIDTDYCVECFVGDRCICEPCQYGMLEDGRLVEQEDGTYAFAPEQVAS